MTSNRSFFRMVCGFAVPIALQSMLQASFSIVDQIMIGQLGSVSVAGVGLAARFSSMYTFMVSAVGTVAGIMISQYLGQRNRREIRRSFWVNMLLAAAMAAVFMLVGVVLPGQIMGLYATDTDTVQAAASYLSIIAWTFLPAAGCTLLSTLLRCADYPSLPLYAGITAAVVNTVLNYMFIFGKLGFAAMGAKGAAIATVIAQLVNLLILLAMTGKVRHLLQAAKTEVCSPFLWGQYLKMLIPVLVTEFMWVLGENVYAAIYGHMGTAATAAMTLTGPIQNLLIGAMCGLSQAAGIIVGKRLGSDRFDDAYDAAKRIFLYGFLGSVCLSVVVALTRTGYVEIYRVEEEVKHMTRLILVMYSFIAPVKVLNMIGGGVLGSGGRTKYLLIINVTGTWVFGVPFGLVSAFVLHLPIQWVYILLSLEECVRLGMCFVIFQKRWWMQSLES